MKIGDTVKRTNGASYERGNVGVVIALDTNKQRAQINWLRDHSGQVFEYTKPRTWMGFKFLVLI